MGVLTWVAVGIAGAFVGRLVFGGGRGGNLIADLIVGIAGGIIGGSMFSWFGHLSIWTLDVPSIVVAFVGSVALVLLVRIFTSGKTSA